MVKIKLGDKVKDTITDLEGTAIAKTIYLNGCIQFQVQSKKLFNGDVVEGSWVDEVQLIKIKPVKKKPLVKRTYGGICNHPKR